MGDCCRSGWLRPRARPISRKNLPFWDCSEPRGRQEHLLHVFPRLQHWMHWRHRVPLSCEGVNGTPSEVGGVTPHASNLVKPLTLLFAFQIHINTQKTIPLRGCLLSAVSGRISSTWILPKILGGPLRAAASIVVLSSVPCDCKGLLFRVWVDGNTGSLHRHQQLGGARRRFSAPVATPRSRVGGADPGRRFIDSVWIGLAHRRPATARGHSGFALRSVIV